MARGKIDTVILSASAWARCMDLANAAERVCKTARFKHGQAVVWGSMVRDLEAAIEGVDSIDPGKTAAEGGRRGRGG